MEAIKIYNQLEKDFITSKMSDNWAQFMSEINDFLSDNFINRSMGLVCDFATEINKIYTAVFPSFKIMKKILDDNIHDALLFVHHPMIWDIRKAPVIFQQMDKELLQEFKKRKISIYNLHVPLDNYGKYSTSVTLTKALGLEPIKPFAQYNGALCGVFGQSISLTVRDLRKRFQETVGHKVSLYNYGDNEIKNNIVAIVAGGGLLETIEEIAQNGVNVLITGISVITDHSKKSHDFAKKQKINILGGTHYSTEKYSCISMVDYFNKLGLDSDFIEGDPILDDI